MVEIDHTYIYRNIMKYWDFPNFPLPCWIARGYSLLVALLAFAATDEVAVRDATGGGAGARAAGRAGAASSAGSAGSEGSAGASHI